MHPYDESDPRVHPYRSMLDEDTRHARELISAMGAAVEQAISRATTALMNSDVPLAEQVIAGDSAVNATHYALRDLCFKIILTQAPVARDLREVLGFHHMGAELERMADHCVGIGRLVRTRDQHWMVQRGHDIRDMAAHCIEQVHDMTDALMGRDLNWARAIAARDRSIDGFYTRIFEAMMNALVAGDIGPHDATSVIFVAHHLERIGDRVTNLAEDLVYLESGAVEELG